MHFVFCKRCQNAVQLQSGIANNKYSNRTSVSRLFCLLICLTIQVRVLSTCAVPELVVNGLILPWSPSFQDHPFVYVDCEAGYHLQGASFVVCGEDGEWSSELPLCLETDECISNPCLNGGTCFDHLNGFTCSCTYLFRGQKCEFKRCETGDPRNCGYDVDGIYSVDLHDGKPRFHFFWVITEDNYGWIVVQRRTSNINLDFNRTWADYEKGFGAHADHVYWLGNQYLARLTASSFNIMRIDVEDWEGNKRYAVLQNTRVAGSEDKYRLTYSRADGSEAIYDSMIRANGSQFSTYDQDNDGVEGKNCADVMGGGWWFSDSVCTGANPNGIYYQRNRAINTGQNLNGIFFFYWKGFSYSAKFCQILLRQY